MFVFPSERVDHIFGLVMLLIQSFHFVSRFVAVLLLYNEKFWIISLQGRKPQEL